MTRKIIPSNLVEYILSGQDDSFIQNDGGFYQIIIKNYEFGHFSSEKDIQMPYDLIFEDCKFSQNFFFKGSSKRNISFINCYHEE
ncbi:MAG TPA: hypothetical protein VGE24_10605, partial [Emticicia sp.]